MATETSREIAVIVWNELVCKPDSGLYSDEGAIKGDEFVSMIETLIEDGRTFGFNAGLLATYKIVESVPVSVILDQSQRAKLRILNTLKAFLKKAGIDHMITEEKPKPKIHLR